MDDIVVGIVAVLTGAVFCFRGYLAMRIIIPIWGAFAGFMLGAGIVADDAGFLATALGWIVGIAVAVVFGLLAYLYYEVAVMIGMMAIGFTLGASVMVALGVTWSWLIVLSGVALAVLLAFVALVGDLPMVLLTVLTGFAGSSLIIFGLMLMFGVTEFGDFDSAQTTKTLDDSWWWYVIYLGLAIAGMVAQFADVNRRRDTLRDAWSTGISSPDDDLIIADRGSTRRARRPSRERGLRAARRLVPRTGRERVEFAGLCRRRESSLLVELMRRRLPAAMLALAVLLVAEGLGSFLYHGAASDASQFLHDVPLIGALGFVAGWHVGRLFDAADRGSLAGMAIGVVGATVLWATAPGATNAIVAIAVATIVAASLVARRRRLAGVWSVPLLVLCAVAVVTWALGSVDSPTCDPGAWLQPHAFLARPDCVGRDRLGRPRGRRRRPGARTSDVPTVR